MERKKRNTKKKNEKKGVIRIEMKQTLSIANTPCFDRVFGVCFVPLKEELKEDKNSWLLSEGREEERNSLVIKGSD